MYFTGDGIADLVVASPGDGRIRVHARSSDGEISGGVSIFVGGAPIYGTDAIAGAVNLIYKTDFEGIAFDVQTQQDERGDASNMRLRGLWGANSDDGKGNVMLGLEYAKTVRIS